jgi:hypothetical protein
MSVLAVVLAALALAAAGPPTRRAVAPPLPAEIADHYRDYNFVNAFSTVRERRLVAEIPVDSSVPRLARVTRAMRRLADRVDHVDPGILGPSPRRWPETTDRADLLRVVSFDLDETRGEAWVHLEALALDQPAQITLVSRFDDLASADREPSVDQLVAATGRSLVRTFEMHRWVRVDGAWRREAATRHFIAR